MRRVLIILTAVIAVQFFAVVFSQQDKLAGRWEGKVQTPQGERNTVVTFKKESDKYTGSTLGMGGNDMPFKEVKVDGNTVTAVAIAQSPQGEVTINYKFTVEGESLKGQGSVDFGGQTFTFDYDLKRASEKAGAATPPPAEQQRQQRQRVEQPQQKQSIDYFVGQWTFKYLGRESALGPAPREGTVTFTKGADGKSLQAKTVGKSEVGAYQETADITFDEATKMMTYSEKLGNGVKLQSKADWSSPISIRFTIDPVKVKGQSIQLRRTISVVAAHSFSVVEELSEDGGPFVRLGQALYTKVGAN
jgi:hypothetical protein